MKSLLRLVSAAALVGTIVPPLLSLRRRDGPRPDQGVDAGVHGRLVRRDAVLDEVARVVPARSRAVVPRHPGGSVRPDVSRPREITMRLRPVRSVVLLVLAVLSAGAEAPRAQSTARSGASVGASPVLEWPAPTPTARPWTRWWWQGSSVTRDGLTAAMEAYRAAGLGGLELTPIYGVRGEEDRFVPYLSPAWMALLDHTMAEATRLGLGLDMATGTGWPFGGPWVGRDEACSQPRGAEVHRRGRCAPRRTDRGQAGARRARRRPDGVRPQRQHPRPGSR